MKIEQFDSRSHALAFERQQKADGYRVVLLSMNSTFHEVRYWKA